MTAMADKLREIMPRSAAYVAACNLLRACDMDLALAQTLLRQAQSDMTATGIRAEDRRIGVLRDRITHVPSASPIASDEASEGLAARPFDHAPPARESNHLGDQSEIGKAAQVEDVPEVPQNRVIDQEPPGREAHAPVVNPRPPIASEANRAAAAKPVSLPPARDPSPGFIRATLAVNQAAARSVLHTVKTSDGRFWADVRPYEIAAMQRDSIRGMALLSVCGALNDKQAKMTFGELLSPDRAKIAFDQAQKELAHVA